LLFAEKGFFLFVRKVNNFLSLFASFCSTRRQYIHIGSELSKVSQKSWFNKDSIIGVTAGASAPKQLVQQIVSRIQEWGAQTVQEMPGKEETISFALPKELRDQ